MRQPQALRPQDHDFCDSLRLFEQPYLELCNRLRLCDRALSFFGRLSSSTTIPPYTARASQAPRRPIPCITRQLQALPRFCHKLHDSLRLCDDPNHEFYDRLRLYDDPDHEFHGRFRLCASLPYILRQPQAPRTPTMNFEDSLRLSALRRMRMAERLGLCAHP